MKIFVDTNILLDTILPRKDKSFTENSALFLELRCVDGYELCVSTISMATIAFYLKDRADSAQRLRVLTKHMTILDTKATDFKAALDINQSDVEDAMQFCVASSNGCNLIVTRDKSGFVKSPITFMTPEKVLSLIR